MDEQELLELEDPDSRDWDNPIVQEGNPSAGAIVSIRLSSDELGQVEACAQHLGMRLTQYIRETVLERARASTSRTG